MKALIFYFSSFNQLNSTYMDNTPQREEDLETSLSRVSISSNLKSEKMCYLSHIPAIHKDRALTFSFKFIHQFWFRFLKMFEKTFFFWIFQNLIFKLFSLPVFLFTFSCSFFFHSQFSWPMNSRKLYKDSFLLGNFCFSNSISLTTCVSVEIRKRSLVVVVISVEFFLFFMLTAREQCRTLQSSKIVMYLEGKFVNENWRRKMSPSFEEWTKQSRCKIWLSLRWLSLLDWVSIWWEKCVFKLQIFVSFNFRAPLRFARAFLLFPGRWTSTLALQRWFVSFMWPTEFNRDSERL